MENKDNVDLRDFTLTTSKIKEMLTKHIFESKNVSDLNKIALQTLFDEQAVRYFTAPASARNDYHSCFEGGLAFHSYNVTQNLFKICESLEIDVDPSSIVIVGMFHDLGKIGTVGENAKNYYVFNKSEWHRKNLGKIYEYNKELDDGLSVPLRSIRNLEHYGFRLTDDEFFAILYHDGLYVEQNRIPEVMMSKKKLPRALQFADSWTAFVDGV